MGSLPPSMARPTEQPVLALSPGDAGTPSVAVWCAVPVLRRRVGVNAWNTDVSRRHARGQGARCWIDHRPAAVPCDARKLAAPKDWLRIPGNGKPGGPGYTGRWTGDEPAPSQTAADRASSLTRSSQTRGRASITSRPPGRRPLDVAEGGYRLGEEGPPGRLINGFHVAAHRHVVPPYSACW
jgi:hypothetical protein